MLKNSNLSWISVSDINKARDFFSNTLGLKEMNFSEEHGWAEMTFEEGGYTLGIAQEDPQLPAGENAVVTITVEDIEEARTAFEKKGVALLGDILEVPGHVRMQMFADPDGNKFQLVQIVQNN